MSFFLFHSETSRLGNWALQPVFEIPGDLDCLESQHFKRCHAYDHVSWLPWDYSAQYRPKSDRPWYARWVTTDTEPAAGFARMQPLCSKGSFLGISPVAPGRVAQWPPICSLTVPVPTAPTHSPSSCGSRPSWHGSLSAQPQNPPRHASPLPVGFFSPRA